jgi:hypothetical protein
LILGGIETLITGETEKGVKIVTDNISDEK